VQDRVDSVVRIAVVGHSAVHRVVEHTAKGRLVNYTTVVHRAGPDVAVARVVSVWPVVVRVVAVCTGHSVVEFEKVAEVVEVVVEVVGIVLARVAKVRP
jgi:hypothetical protein